MDSLQDQMMAELLVRMERDPSAFRREAPQPPDRPWLTPDRLHTIGGLADAASTYGIHKFGRGRESNRLVSGLSGGSPERMGLAALGGLAASKLALALLRKKWPGLADALAANLGAEQVALAVSNLNPGDDGRGSGYGLYVDAFRPPEMK